MLRKTGLILLLTAIAFSCKSVPDENAAETSEVQTEEVTTVQGDSGETALAMEDTPEQTASDEPLSLELGDSEELLPEDATPPLEEDSPSVKIDAEPEMAFSKPFKASGGRKRGVPDDPPETDPVIEETVEIKEPAISTPMDPEPEEEDSTAEESLAEPPFQVIEELSVEITEEGENDLPFERDALYNPLIPVVIDAADPEIQEKEESAAAVLQKPEAEEQDEPREQESAFANAPVEPEKPAELPEPEDEQPPSEENDTIRPIESGEYVLLDDSTGKLSISLEGSGWIFLSDGGRGDIKLSDKRYDPGTGRTVFVFNAPDKKGYNGELVFLKQDILKGLSEKRSLTIDDGNNPYLTAGDIESSDSVDDKEPLGNLEGDIAETIAEPESFAGESLAAEAGIDDETSQEISSDVIAEAADEPESVPQAEINSLSPSALLELAAEYERPGPGQSLEQAMEIYQLIKRKYPVSEERFSADSRIRYLNRYYFKVQ